MSRTKNSVAKPLLGSASGSCTAELVIDDNGQKSERRIDYAIIFSIIFHIILFFLFSRAGRVVQNYSDIKQVTFIDQSYRPEVAKVLPKSPGSPNGRERGFISPVPMVVASGGEGPINEEVGTINLSSKLDRSQAVIDLNRYEVDRNRGELDVIRIGNQANGTQKSTEEILLEKPIKLSEGFARGSNVPGLAGYPGLAISGEPEIKIEHRALEKPRVADKPEIAKPNLSSEPVLPIAKGTGISIAGLISGRTIINKVLPKYPEWALKKELSGAVILKLWVLPDGSVKSTIQVEQSSGYPDLDQTVISALAGWRFAALPKDVVQENQWGIITFRFTLI